MAQNDTPVKALVLAGGGARGSYQVGVWRALMELDWHPQIITGTSVGSLNGAMFALDLYETARDMWTSIRSQDVMELPEEDADLSALHQFLRSVVKAGGMDVTPLEEIVERVLDEDALLELNMTLVGGMRYKSGGAAVKISGAFWIQVPLGFEDFPILNIAEGVNGELLPFQIPPSTLVYLMPAAG